MPTLRFTYDGKLTLENLILKEVILGLNCQVPIEKIRNLKTIQDNNIKVWKAGMALRSFKIIEDRDYRKVIKSI